MSISMQNQSNHAIQSFASLPSTNLNLNNESLQAAVREALLDGNTKWIEKGILDGTIDPNMSIRLEKDSMVIFSTRIYMNSPDDSKKNAEETIHNALKILGSYEFDGNTNALKFHLKNLENHISILEIIKSDLCLASKEKSLNEYFEVLMQLAEDAGFKFLDMPLQEIAQKMKYSDLTELLEVYGADSEPNLKVEIDSNKVSREQIESTFPEGTIVV